MPILALRSSDLKALRAWTKVALRSVSGAERTLWRWKGGYARHERRSERVEEEGDGAGETADGGTETSAAGQEGSEEGQGHEEEGHEDEDPGEPPHVVVVEARGVAAVAPDEAVRCIVRAAVPGLTEGRSRTGRAAVIVVAAAEVEVGPLGDVAGASDAGGVGAQEVDVVQGSGVGNAREDDEPQQEE